MVLLGYAVVVQAALGRLVRANTGWCPMSMHDPLFGDYPIPDETRRVAQAAFPKGNV